MIFKNNFEACGTLIHPLLSIVDTWAANTRCDISFCPKSHDFFKWSHWFYRLWIYGPSESEFWKFVNADLALDDTSMLLLTCISYCKWCCHKLLILVLFFRISFTSYPNLFERSAGRWHIPVIAYPAVSGPALNFIYVDLVLQYLMRVYYLHQAHSQLAP